MNFETFIDPKTLARVKDLPLVAKTVAEGFLFGQQLSTQRGVGIEFSQYRSYENGDELSHIDWKLFARSDRYFVREAERESEIDVWFILDASLSMSQKSDSNAQGDSQWNKFEYAKHLIASLSYIAQKQGDSIGFWGLSSEQLNFLPKGNSEMHWRKLLSCLSTTRQGCFFPSLAQVENTLNQFQKPSLICVVSDFNQKDNEIIEFVSKFNSMRSEVIAFQPICHDEIDFNFKGATRFKDLETGEELLVSAREAKANYKRNYKAYQKKLDEELASRNIACHRFNIDYPLDEILFEYLKRRTRVAS